MFLRTMQEMQNVFNDMKKLLNESGNTALETSDNSNYLNLLSNDTLTKDQLSLVHEDFNYLVYQMEMSLEVFLLRLQDTYPEHLKTIEQTTKMFKELQQLDTKILDNLETILGPLIR